MPCTLLQPSLFLPLNTHLLVSVCTLCGWVGVCVCVCVCVCLLCTLCLCHDDLSVCGEDTSEVWKVKEKKKILPISFKTHTLLSLLEMLTTIILSLDVICLWHWFHGDGQRFWLENTLLIPKAICRCCSSHSGHNIADNGKIRCNKHINLYYLIRPLLLRVGGGVSKLSIWITLSIHVCHGRLFQVSCCLVTGHHVPPSPTTRLIPHLFKPECLLWFLNENSAITCMDSTSLWPLISEWGCNACTPQWLLSPCVYARPMWWTLIMFLHGKCASTIRMSAMEDCSGTI